jgi:hypothetical protein
MLLRIKLLDAEIQGYYFVSFSFSSDKMLIFPSIYLAANILYHRPKQCIQVLLGRYHVKKWYLWSN